MALAVANEPNLIVVWLQKASMHLRVHGVKLRVSWTSDLLMGNAQNCNCQLVLNLFNHYTLCISRLVIFRLCTIIRCKIILAASALIALSFHALF